MANQEPSAEGLIYQLIDLTVDMTRTTNALIDDVLRKLNLTHALANALWQLDPGTAAPSMSQLAQRLRCDPSTVTALADRLEERGLVSRSVDPGNRRVKTLALTAQGRNARKQLVSAMSTRTPIARLSTMEQREFLRLLTKAMHTGTAR